MIVKVKERYRTTKIKEKAMLFTEVKGGIASEIAAKEALIAQLQAEVSAHLNYAQEVQSSEVASETALQQMQVAIDMLKQIGCPDGLKALEKAVKEQFKEAKEPRKKAALLTAAATQETEEDTEVNEVNNETDVPDTLSTEPVETTVTVVDDDGLIADEPTETEVESFVNTPPGHVEVNHSDLFSGDAWANEPVKVW
jgi:hypothetical protein